MGHRLWPPAESCLWAPAGKSAMTNIKDHDVQMLHCGNWVKPAVQHDSAQPGQRARGAAVHTAAVADQKGPPGRPVRALAGGAKPLPSCTTDARVH